MDKATQRATLIAARRAISPRKRDHWDMQIAEQVLTWCRNHSVSTVGVYSPIQAEPDLHSIYPSLIKMGIQLALPSAPLKDHLLTFLAWQPGEELMKDRYGVLVPLDGAKVVQPDALFIPCVGFNARGFRLGYGGGFYDRTLASSPRPRAIGIAYRIGLCELTESAHDIPMDCMITDY